MGGYHNHSSHRAWESVRAEGFWQHVERFFQQLWTGNPQSFNPSWQGSFKQPRLETMKARAAQELQEHTEVVEAMVRSDDPKALKAAALAHLREVARENGQPEVAAFVACALPAWCLARVWSARDHTRAPHSTA